MSRRDVALSTSRVWPRWRRGHRFALLPAPLTADGGSAVGMKSSHGVVLALTLSFAVSQAQPVPSLKGTSQRSSESLREQTISIDLLRQPLSRKARQILEKAQQAALSDDHARAIRLLESAHAKYPESDAWTESLLGVEYIKTRQFALAVTTLERAVRMLPRDAANRSNLGFAFASTGRYDLAEIELRKALTLNSGSPKTKDLLDVVLALAAKHQTEPTSGATPNIASTR